MNTKKTDPMWEWLHNKKQEVSVDIIETDFGTVKLSKRSLDWLNSIDNDWRKIIKSKRRGKHRNYVKEQVSRLEDAVNVTASIAWFAKDILKEY